MRAPCTCELFPRLPAAWRNDALAEDWEAIKRVRRVVTGALEIERANKKIGSSLEAAPRVFVADETLLGALADVDFAEVCITSGIEVVAGDPPTGAFTLADVAGVGVVPKLAEGKKCARSWRITGDVGSDPAFPISPRGMPRPCASSTIVRTPRIDRLGALHYTVVHEQDEQVRGLQLARHARPEGRARSSS